MGGIHVHEHTYGFFLSTQFYFAGHLRLIAGRDGRLPGCSCSEGESLAPHEIATLGPPCKNSRFLSRVGLWISVLDFLMEHKIVLKIHKPLECLAARRSGDHRDGARKATRCSATFKHTMATTSGRRPHATTLVGSYLATCCELFLACCLDECCFRAVENIVDVRFLSTADMAAL